MVEACIRSLRALYLSPLAPADPVYEVHVLILQSVINS